MAMMDAMMLCRAVVSGFTAISCEILKFHKKNGVYTRLACLVSNAARPARGIIVSSFDFQDTSCA
jgi:hypothetical protein